MIMNIEIRIRIAVPDSNRDTLQYAVDNIIDYVGMKFPGLKQIPMQSPVTVTIKELDYKVDEAANG